MIGKDDPMATSRTGYDYGTYQKTIKDYIEEDLKKKRERGTMSDAIAQSLASDVTAAAGKEAGIQPRGASPLRTAVTSLALQKGVEAATGESATAAAATKAATTEAATTGAAKTSAFGSMSPAAQSASIYGGAALIMAVQEKNAERQKAIIDDIVRQRKDYVSALSEGQARQDRALASLEAIYAKGFA